MFLYSFVVVVVLEVQAELRLSYWSKLRWCCGADGGDMALVLSGRGMLRSVIPRGQGRASVAVVIGALAPVRHRRTRLGRHLVLALCSGGAGRIPLMKMLDVTDRMRLSLVYARVGHPLPFLARSLYAATLEGRDHARVSGSLQHRCLAALS